MMHMDKSEALSSMPAIVPPHEKALLDHPAYLAVGMHRIPVPPEKVSWSVPWPEYDAIRQDLFDHPVVTREYLVSREQGWAAAPGEAAMAKRTRSYVVDLPVNAAGEVLNPGGRTGIKEGRGLLGKVGPNFAADPIIFRLSPENGELQILLVQRKDTGAWALPGGMTNYGEMVAGTLQRELHEETGLRLSMQDATVVYKGYVDDPRNTDKAWMETVAAMKLLSEAEGAAAKVKGGSDARKAQWRRVDSQLLGNLYASHAHFIRLALVQLPIVYGERLGGVAQQIVASRE